MLIEVEPVVSETINVFIFDVSDTAFTETYTAWFVGSVTRVYETASDVRPQA